MAESNAKCQLEAYQLCGIPPKDEDELNFEGDNEQIRDRAEAYFRPCRLWIGETTLNVFFKNSQEPEFRDWNVTTDQIIGWANESWTRGTNAPKFRLVTNETNAHIRVKFSNSGGCWSKTGTRARNVKFSDPTMMLNLGLAKGVVKKQRSLVLHEFGHALGFEHEHQRADLWRAIFSYIDTDALRRDEMHLKAVCDLGKGMYGSNWLQKDNFLATLELLFAKPEGCDYDGNSIMHFEFKKNWFKQEYRAWCVEDIERIDRKKPERKFLLDIFEQFNDPSPWSLAYELSEGDKDAVHAAYP